MESYERFGRYLILDHVQDGGMAKVSRALMMGDQAKKIVIIKQMKKNIAEEPDFVTMFMDEVKTTFDLKHPSIAQTFDYGTLNDKLFIVMEYIDGCSLRSIMKHHIRIQKQIPISLIIYMISQVCQGMYYAHSFKNKLLGKKTNIIHRDISPDNIMVSYEGYVKIIDFGIAKADTNTEHTNVGSLKGKLSYFAPEYLEGEQIDHRYDIFGLGIVLWEMLTLKTLFERDPVNFLHVLKKIQKCIISPPSTHNHDVPKALDAIVMKALQKNPTHRYRDMAEFNHELMKFLNSYDRNFVAHHLQEYISLLFSDQIKRNQDTILEYGKIDLTKYWNNFKNEQSGIHNTIKPINNTEELMLDKHKHEYEKKVENKYLKQKESKHSDVKLMDKYGRVDDVPDFLKDEKQVHPTLTFDPSPNDIDDTKRKVSKLEKIIIVIAFLYASGWSINKIYPYRVIYSHIMNEQGTLILSGITASKDLQVFINERQIVDFKKPQNVPINQTFYVRYIKKGMVPTIIPVTLNNRGEEKKLPLPKFSKSPSGVAILECEEGKDFPPDSKLIIEMPSGNVLYIISLPFDRIHLPVGTYKAHFNEQDLSFDIRKDLQSTIKIVKPKVTKEKKNNL